MKEAHPEAPSEIDALLDSERRHNGAQSCARSTLAGTALAVFDRGVERTDVSTSAVVRVLTKLGVSITDQTIKRHRRGECVACRDRK